MVAKISETQRIRTSVVPQDITTLRTGAFIDVSGAQRMAAAVAVATVAATKTVTVQLMQAQDAAGTGAKVMGAPAVLTAPTGGAPIDAVVDAQITDLDSANGFSFLAVQLSSNNATAVYGSGLMMLSGNRYNP